MEFLSGYVMLLKSVLDPQSRDGAEKRRKHGGTRGRDLLTTCKDLVSNRKGKGDRSRFDFLLTCGIPMPNFLRYIMKPSAKSYMRMAVISHKGKNR